MKNDRNIGFHLPEKPRHHAETHLASGYRDQPSHRRPARGLPTVQQGDVHRQITPSAKARGPGIAGIPRTFGPGAASAGRLGHPDPPIGRRPGHRICQNRTIEAFDGFVKG
ncbi:hypothetical protein GCM10022416_31210 [Actinomadura keratinilytica]|uniref:Transposase n=1 Tax=Actinomadura keratinilytica TaxID=547461 RepID=A0ABP7YWC5_9ACTN